MSDRIVVLGAGMHPWGKWGKSFIEYGVVAAKAALKDAGVAWKDVDFVSGAATMRNGYPGYVPGATFAKALGWNGAQIASSYAACASGVQAIAAARAQLLAGLCDVALVVGSDTTPKGFLAATTDDPDDPNWMRFRAVGATNPSYFGLYARRRMAEHGSTRADFAAVKVKNSRHGLTNPYARYRKAFTKEQVLGAKIVSDPLGLLDICATSDGAAALILCREETAKKFSGNPVTIAGVSTVTPQFPDLWLDMPNFATDSAFAVRTPARSFRDSIARTALEEAGVEPGDLDLAEVYDLSTALELNWYENIGLCEPGGAEAMLHDGQTTHGGSCVVNPSGGLACFGEAVPAQAIAQVCEVAWQLRGDAGDRQVEGARAGVTGNQGLFGHGSSVVLTK